jgi:hypothetical protein
MKASLDEWASANKTVRELQRGLTRPERRPIRNDFAGYVHKLGEQQAFKQVCAAKCTVEEIEIANLVAFQRHIDIEYADKLAEDMRKNDHFVLESCLPLNFHQNLDVTFDPAIPAVSFSSYSPKLALTALQAVGIGGPEVSIGGQTVEQPGAIFLIGTQSNFVQVTEFDSRFILKNGYHRAYAAMLAGRKYIPAIVSQISDFVETGAVRPGFFSRDRMVDFLNDSIAIGVKVRAMRKVIRLSVDEFFIPR